MKAFKVGDKVVYAKPNSRNGYSFKDAKGEVTTVDEGGYVWCAFDKHNTGLFTEGWPCHPDELVKE